MIPVIMSIHSIAEATAHLSELVSRVHAHHEHITVTVHGTPSAVLLSPDDLERMEETIAVPSDSTLMAQLIEAEGDLPCGDRHSRRPDEWVHEPVGRIFRR